MDPVTNDVVISRPVAEVYAYLLDISNHPEFTDHFTQEWHLTREDSVGRGAGARWKLKQRFNQYAWVDGTIIDVVPDHRIVIAGRTGKFNRVRVVQVFELEPTATTSTRLTHSYETQKKLPSDRSSERRGYQKRSWSKALRRLRSILEEDRDRGRRASIAGGPRKPATGAPIR